MTALVLPARTTPAGAVASSGVDRGRDTADRRVGWMIAVGGAFLVAGSVGVTRGQWGGFAPWWEATAVALAGATLGAAALGAVLPAGAVRGASWAFPGVSLLLLATWTAARTQAGLGVDTGPWVWQLEPTAVALAAVAWPLPVAVAYSQVSALTVLAAALATDGHASRELLLAVLVHLGNVVFVVVFAAIRDRLSALREAEERVAAGVTRLARARADEAERTRLASVVHDEVLATLTIAAQSEGPPSASLAGQARRALTVALGEAVDPPRAPLPAEALVTVLRTRLHALGPAVVVQARADAVDVPPDVADAVLGALEEAVRNSLRHADWPAPRVPVSRHVDVTIDRHGLHVTASDDGVGFDPEALDPRRLGVRRSILERMSAVPGAAATVWSRPGCGTRVDLSWRRP